MFIKTTRQGRKSQKLACLTIEMRLEHWQPSAGVFNDRDLKKKKLFTFFRKSFLQFKLLNAKMNDCDTTLVLCSWTTEKLGSSY